MPPPVQQYKCRCFPAPDLRDTDTQEQNSYNASYRQGKPFIPNHIWQTEYTSMAPNLLVFEGAVCQMQPLFSFSDNMSDLQGPVLLWTWQAPCSFLVRGVGEMVLFGASNLLFS